MRRIAVKLTVSFLVVIVLVSGMFSVMGTRIINERIDAEAEAEVEAHVDAAVDLYLASLDDLNDVVRFAALRFFLRNAILQGNIAAAEGELANIWSGEHLDLLTVTDDEGTVLVRAANPAMVGDSRAGEQWVRAVLARREPVAGTNIVARDVLAVECPHLADRADCPLPGESGDPEPGGATGGMMMQAAAPIFDYEGRIIGVIYGGVLLNGRHDVTADIAETVFGDEAVDGGPPGAMAIYQGDIVITTSAGSLETIGTTALPEIYTAVLGRGEEWIGPTRLGDTSYVSAFEPIVDVDGRAVGMLQVGLLEAPFRDVRRSSTMTFLVISLGGAVVVMGLSWFVSNRISGPIRRLVGASRRVAGGDFDARVAVASNDELAELAHAFNSMALALQERMEQIAEFAQSRIKESERLAVIGQLAADVAHELNNPLQGVVAYAHLLLEQTQSDDPRRLYLEKIADQADRSTSIIRALLDFSRPRKPTKRTTDLNAVLEDCVALVEEQALFHNIEIVRNLQPGLPSVVVDPSQMQQVFVNLILNAAEAMEGSGRLTLTTRFRDEDDTVDVVVEDTGGGIPEGDLEKIFDPFFSTKPAMHGTGLGLAISYGIVREHGGRISAASVVGEGATFIVEIPAAGESDGGDRDGE